MYFITTLDPKDEDTRCVGYFKTFKEAEEVVLQNICDIWETCYTYVVIEHIPEGLYQYDQNIKWYKWNKEKEIYEKLKNKPPQYKNMVGFAIG